MNEKLQQTEPRIDGLRPELYIADAEIAGIVDAFTSALNGSYQAFNARFKGTYGEDFDSSQNLGAKIHAVCSELGSRGNQQAAIELRSWHAVQWIDEKVRSLDDTGEEIKYEVPVLDDFGRSIIEVTGVYLDSVIAYEHGEDARVMQTRETDDTKCREDILYSLHGGTVSVRRWCYEDGTPYHVQYVVSPEKFQ